MTATIRGVISSWSPEFYRKAARRVLPAALLAVAPKCLLCVLAYAGVGASLGLGGREWCGAPAGESTFWLALLAWVGAAGVMLAAVFSARCRGGRGCAACTPGQKRRG
jgi:hypothetical protein